MKKPVHIFLIFILCMSISLKVDAFTFSRTLTLGSTGQDVLELQKILNTNTQTQIAFTGAGSPGQETTYFGDLTLQAVIKLQNLYAGQILNSVGLTQATGFVGQSTLSFLNRYQDQIRQGAQIQNTQTTPNTTITTDINLINTLGQSAIDSILQNYFESSSQIIPRFYPLVTASHPGKYIRRNRSRVFVDKEFRISSDLMIKNLDFFLGSNKMNKSCILDYVCDLYINKNTAPGVYTLSSSNPELGSHTFTVVSMSVPYPVVNIEKFKVGETNTITGNHFTKNMKVYTVFGPYDVQTQNNSFVLSVPNEFIANFTNMNGAFYVENEFGLRSAPLIITYEK